jgi:hypothetical protein
MLHLTLDRGRAERAAGTGSWRFRASARDRTVLRETGLAYERARRCTTDFCIILSFKGWHLSESLNALGQMVEIYFKCLAKNSVVRSQASLAHWAL